MSVLARIGAAVLCVSIVPAVAMVGVTEGGQAGRQRTQEQQPAQAGQHWAVIANEFIEDYFRAQPFFAAESGRHEFDGQLPDLSALGLKHEVDRLHAARARISAVDAAALQPRERFDREYLIGVIDRDLFWMEKAKYPFSNPYWYIDAIDPDLYLNHDYAPLDVRMKAYIKFARAIPKTAADIQNNLRPPLPSTYVELGIADFGGFVDFFSKDVAPIFASVKDPALQGQLADANAHAAAAMGSLTTYLVGLRKTATNNFPLGKALYAQMLHDTEKVDVPVEEIEAAGRADLERNTRSLREECAVYLPKGSVLDCVTQVMADKPTNGPLAAARLQLVELKNFVRDHDVVSIPNGDEALVAQAPPYNSSNAAFIQLPGAYDHGVAATYNIAAPDPKWSKVERDAYVPSNATLLFTSVHEVWPGHFLQFMHSNANADKLEGLWVGYAFAEGWAHYCEEMMYEEGLGRGDPAKHIGQIIEALLRNVRLLSSIGMHTGSMTVAQSEQMFREQAFQDPGNARQQAARGTYDPAYLNYTLGKLMIRKLRTDWLAKAPVDTGANFRSQWHKFHDLFLSYGGPPIPLLRKEMLGSAGKLL
jgi:uncharacterized protein (DUF885 family)